MAFLYFGKKEPPLIVGGVKSWINCHYNFTHNGVKDLSKMHTPAKDTYHNHDYIELLYGIDKKMIAYINGKDFHISPGDLVIVHSNELHAFEYETNSVHICVQFSPHILCADEQSYFELKYLLPVFDINERQRLFHKGELGNLDFGQLITESMKEWQRRENGYEPIIRGNLLKIYGEIYRIWNKDRTTNISALTNTMKKALTYVSENFSGVTEADVASYVGLTPNYFSNCFKKAVGKNFKEYIMSLKLREAENLLISTDKSITEIAMEAGFSSTSHLISQFKTHKNTTPKQFRKKMNNL